MSITGGNIFGKRVKPPEGLQINTSHYLEFDFDKEKTSQEIPQNSESGGPKNATMKKVYK